MDSASGNIDGDATRSSVKDIRSLEDLLISVQVENNLDYFYRDFVRTGLQGSRIPVASEFRYDDFRAALLRDGQIPLDATLYPPKESGVVSVDSRSSCIIALTQVQGSTTINLAGNKSLPTLVLTPDPAGRPSTPPNPDQNLIKTADSPGDQLDDESKDIPDDQSDDEYDDKTGNNNDIMKHLSFDWATVTDKFWDEVCLFFGCDRDATIIRIDGIRVGIEPYQAVAIYRALIQPRNNLNSFILGDDVGLGKTGMAFCIAIIAYQIHFMRADMFLSGIFPRRHLPENSSPTAICPSQKKGFVRCPCHGDSITDDIALNWPNYPTLIITLPGLVPTFVGEADKWIDSSPGSSASPITVHVAHPSYLNTEKSFGPEAINSLRFENDQPDNRHIVIISSSRITSFMSHFLDNAGKCGVRAGLVLFDEFHKYKGDKTRTTIPFKMLETLYLASESDLPPFAIGLSGSARADCSYWRPFIRHNFHVYERQVHENEREPAVELHGLKKYEDFDHYENCWRQLVGTLNDTTLQGNKLKARDSSWKSLSEFLPQFISQMMISRQRGDTFRGKEILGRRRTQLIKCDTPVGALQGIVTLVSQVQSLINEEYRVALNNWIKENKKGEKPIKREIAQRRLEFISDSPRRTAASRAHQLLLRSSTFPTVAQLVGNKSVNYEGILGNSVVPIATRISKILVPKKLDYRAKTEALGVIQSSTWWKHKDILYEQSPKIKEVERQINSLIEISEKNPDDPDLATLGPPPSDETTIRHLLLFADYPLSAFLMLMILFPKYSERNVVFMYAHSGVSVKERQEYVDYIQKDCKEGDPVKILISTMNIIGHGFNIFRASTVIITEVPRSSEIQKQAFGRVDRRGQVMEPNLIQLHDRNNLLEEIRRIRNENRDQLAGVGQDSGPSYPLADLILGQVDNGQPDEEADDGGDGDGGDDGDDEDNHGTVLRIDGYHDAEAYAAARQAFPNGRFRRYNTSGFNHLCGLKALQGSIRRQFDRADLEVPEDEELLNCILSGMDEVQLEEFNNFSADGLQAGLREWARRGNINRQFRIGYISQTPQRNVAHLIPARAEDDLPFEEQTVVWVKLQTDGDNGHFEAVSRQNDV